MGFPGSNILRLQILIWLYEIHQMGMKVASLHFVFCVIFRVSSFCSGDKGSGRSKVKQKIMEGRRFEEKNGNYGGHLGRFEL